MIPSKLLLFPAWIPPAAGGMGKGWSNLKSLGSWHFPLENTLPLKLGLKALPTSKSAQEDSLDKAGLNLSSFQFCAHIYLEPKNMAAKTDWVKAFWTLGQRL